MYFIYQVLKIIVKVALRIYFSETKIKNRERLQFKGPAIVVSNHQNTLMDVLVTAAPARAQFYFLANAGLFKSKFGNWFFNTFYCIPIERTLDTNGKPTNNEANFARVHQHLENGGTIYIAPEGTSWMKRHLHPLKTGTARIAFSAEQKNDYGLDLQILPLGLNYSDHNGFRSQLFIKVGEPLYMRDFREMYAADPIQAVRHVTDLLEAQMRELMLHTRDDAEDALLKKLEEILQNNTPLNIEAQYYRSRKVLEQLHSWRDTADATYIKFEQKVNEYYKLLNKYHIDDQAVATAPGRGIWLNILGAIIGLPVFLYGFINNFLPAWIPAATMRYLKERYNLYIGYTSTVKISLGVVTFPLFYWLQSELVQDFWGTSASWWYLLSLPITGWVALKYEDFATELLSGLRLKGLSRNNQIDLKAGRKEIINELAHADFADFRRLRQSN